MCAPIANCKPLGTSTTTSASSPRRGLANVFDGLAGVLARMREADDVEPPWMPDEILKEARKMRVDLEGDDDGER